MGGDRNHFLLWPVLPTPPVPKSTWLMMGLMMGLCGKEASVADCKNLLGLQHLETHGLGANEACVPML